MTAKKQTPPVKVIIRKRYDQHINPGLKTTTPTLTKQAFKDECDVNNILKNFEKTGQLPDLIKAQPQYGDFSEVAEYQDAMNVVAVANQQFANLPAHTRDRFNNNPAQFLEFVDNPENAQELIKMGLATERSKPPRTVENVLESIESRLPTPEPKSKAKNEPKEP